MLVIPQGYKLQSRTEPDGATWYDVVLLGEINDEPIVQFPLDVVDSIRIVSDLILLRVVPVDNTTAPAVVANAYAVMCPHKDGSILAELWMEGFRGKDRSTIHLSAVAMTNNITLALAQTVYGAGIDARLQVPVVFNGSRADL